MKIYIRVITTLLIIMLSACSYSPQKDVPDAPDKPYIEKKDWKQSDVDATVLEHRLYTAPLDKYRRPVSAHIRLSDKDRPEDKRDSKITTDPVGWRNYKVQDYRGRDYWLYNRSHLIGYQFSGLNSEKENIFTGTAYVNKGAPLAMNMYNSKSMLYYEMALRHWLEENPDKMLDYKVELKYNGADVVPKEIVLSYIGYKSDGTPVQIDTGSIEQEIPKDRRRPVSVTLENTDPTHEINYKNTTYKKKDTPL